jgi:hypothetical protein
VGFVAEIFELLGHEGGGFYFLKAELGIGMEVLEDIEEAGFFLGDEGGDFFGELGVWFVSGDEA